VVSPKWRSFFKNAGLLWLATEVVENWDDIKEGLSKGWNDAGN
jgi:hypothetical protein